MSAGTQKTPRRPTQAQLRKLIEEAANDRAEKRAYSPGCDIDDWIAAEAEVMARLKNGLI
ncbi:MAG TPA: DUF2934 domain-containing protein [Burkholderiales bacterium]|jgi:hypothetical protein|nr:DUF2934 domain-containing protein [Burkholderiales bacterium]